MRREKLNTTFQLLSASIVIEFEDPLLAPQFDYIAVGAEQNIRPGTVLSYHVSGTGPYEVFEEGQLLARAPSPADVQFHVYQRIYGRTLERYVLAGWIGLHGALVNICGRRMLLLGDKGAGKTTLTSSLLFANHMIEGDELVLLREGMAMACPRRLHLKPGIERQIPELAPHLADLPHRIRGSRGSARPGPNRAGLPVDDQCRSDRPHYLDPTQPWPRHNSASSLVTGNSPAPHRGLYGLGRIKAAGV